MLAFLAAASALAAFSPPQFLAEPLLDGRCDEYGAPMAMFDGVSIHVAQTAGHVWLCTSWAHGGYGVANWTVSAPALAEPLNLHASMQLGEWPAGRPEAGPQDPQSALWWNHSGWSANATQFNGLEPGESGSRPKFRPVTAREFQLSKARFGRGTWTLALAMSHVGTAAGTPISVAYPPQGQDPLAIEVR